MINEWTYDDDNREERRLKINAAHRREYADHADVRAIIKARKVKAMEHWRRSLVVDDRAEIRGSELYKDYTEFAQNRGCVSMNPAQFSHWVIEFIPKEVKGGLVYYVGFSIPARPWHVEPELTPKQIGERNLAEEQARLDAFMNGWVATLIVDEWCRTKARDLYSNYVQYADNQKRIAMNMTNWGSWMRRFHKYLADGRTMYKGIGIPKPENKS